MTVDDQEENAVEAHRVLRCRATLTSDNPLVDDHRVHGVRTLPGVTFLDFVYRLLDERGFALDRVGLRDVLFVEPVVTDAEFDREIEVEVEPGRAWRRVRARSRKLPHGRPPEEEWTSHMEAELHVDLPAPQPAAEPVGTGQPTDVERVYELGAAADIRHRSFMTCAGTFRRAADGMSAEIALGEEAAESGDDFLLHPALLDAATMQTYALAYSGEEEDPRPLIPFHIGAFRATGPLGAACGVRLGLREPAGEGNDVLQADIDLVDAEGLLLARFEKLVLKRIRSRELITRLTVGGTPEHAEASPADGRPAPTPERPGDGHALRRGVLDAVGALLGQDAETIETDRGFYELGLDSAQLLSLVRALEQRWSIDLYPTLLFEHTTVESVAAYLADLVPPEAARPADVPAPAEEPRPAAAETLCLTGTWSPEPEPEAAPERPVRRLLLVGEPSGSTAQLEEAARRLPHRPETVVARPGSLEEYRLLLDDLARNGRLPDAVVHSGREPGTGLPEAVESDAVSLLALARALLELPARVELPLLHLASPGDESAATVPAALTGAARTIRIEQPGLSCAVVEMFGRSPLGAGALSALLRRELTPGAPAWVRYRDGRRYVRRYREVPFTDSPAPSLRDRGVYLISGGNGVLGRFFAALLAREARARLVLFGRSELDEEVRAELRALEARYGAEVGYLRADAADAADMARVVREARARYGEVNGVLHAAGTLRDGLVRHKEASQVREVLAPKVRGACHLDEATRGEPLDFFALFSSVTGTVGNAGQSDYAVANAFVNAYARARDAAGRPGSSLAFGWPLWDGGGMRTDASTDAYFGRHGQSPLTAEPGAEAFRAGLGRGEAELVLFHGERRRILRSLDAKVPGAPFDLPLAAADEPPSRPAPHPNVSAAPRPADEPRHTSRDIAVIGLAGRYPGARDVDELWRNLAAGRDCVGEVPQERWPQRDFYDPERNTPGRSVSKWGGFLDDADHFDPHFFQITPREAEGMDPQERLFLETVWHTMEDAGCTREGLADSRVGVFAGVMFNQYQMLGLEAPERLPVLPGSFSSSVANRVSYFFDFTGPSLAVDTMCSSSLVALHLACQSLLAGECELAFAGGVNVAAHPYKYLYLSQAGFLSSDGRCRSFGSGGDGYVPGEGVGAVLLKPLERALADGDPVHGVVKGSAVNHGGRSGGFFVPRPDAQTGLLRSALERSGVDPATIGYLEAHGTGTALGDPIEMAALERVFGARGAGREPVPIGSVKSNLGHLEPAAGIAGLTKVLLQMRHRTLAPSLHAEEVNPAVDWDAAPFRVQRTTAPWARSVAREGRPIPRRSGVSAFGAGGANGHVVLEEAPETPAYEEAGAPQLVVLSAKKEENLRQLAERYVEFLDARRSPVPRDAGGPDDAELLRIATELSGLTGETPGAEAALDEWGLDTADLRRFEQQLAERFSDSGPAPRLALDSTLAQIAEHLSGTARPDGADAEAGPSLAELAHTAQTGREAMAERLAVVVSDMGELREALRDFAAHGADGRVHRGSVSTGAKAGSADEGAVREALAGRDLAALARLWVTGVPVEWRELWRGSAPRRVALPLYPFTRRRCWVGSESPEPSRAEPEAPSGSEFTYVPVWEPAAAPAAPGGSTGSVLIVHAAAARGLAEALAQRHPHQRVVRAELAGRTERLGEGHWLIDAADPQGPAVLREELAELGTVHFLGGLHDGTATEALPALERAEEAGVRALFRTAARLAVPLAGAGPLRWTIVTNDVWPVAGSPVTNPGAGGLAGMARVLESEHPQWSCPVVDLGGSGGASWGEVADRLLAEPPARGVRVAYRGGVRYEQALRATTLPAPAGGGIRTGGTYVIIGGAGGIGARIAGFLAGEHAARVALVGRSPLDEERERRIAAADPDGSHLAYFQADAAREAELRDVLARVRERFGAVHGVIQAALVNTSGLVRNLADADMLAGLAAKSRATVALAEVFRDEPLDFLALFSSAQAFLGDPGLAHYAAGSTFQDSYAHALDARTPFPVRAVDWGYWGTVGAVSGEAEGRRLLDAGFRSIAPREGWRTLLRALAGEQPQVLALPAEERLLRRLNLASASPSPSPSAAREAAADPDGMAESFVLDEAGAASIAAFHALDARMTEAAVGWLLRLLDGMGAWHGPEDAADPATIAGRIGVVPRYERLLAKVLDILEEAGLLRAAAGRYGPAPGALARCREEDHAARLDALADERADLAVFVRLLSMCLRRYPELLRGEVLATDLLFPGSGTSLMEGLYKGNPISDVYNGALERCLLSAVRERLSTLEGEERVRILEIGSGTGGTTAGLLRQLAPYGERLEYTYTDLSAAFLEHGRREYGSAYPFLRFKRLDIDREPEAQGFEPGSYDLVVAANVLHATRDVHRTLVHTRTALRPGGMLFLNELTSVTVQSTVVYGLLDGWWQHDDPARRLPGSPLLDAAGWREAAARCGFEGFAALPDARRTSENFQHVLVAQRGASAEAPPAAPPIEPVRAAAAEVPDDGSLRADVQGDLLRLTSDASGIAVEDLDTEQDLGAFGFDSVSYSLLARRLNEEFGFDLSPTVFYETPSLRALVDKLVADHPVLLRERYGGTGPAASGGESEATGKSDGPNGGLPHTPPEPAFAVPAAASGADEPVAVVGMAGRLPGGADLEAFWRRLEAGDDLVTEVPADREALRAPGRRGAFVEDVDLFDPLFFGISPREAEGMDPQQRLFLQAVWTGLEDAGIAPGTLAGSDTALFVGAGSHDYEELQTAAGVPADAYAATANTHSILANRISYCLDLRGPSEPVNTGCSSSLVALHRAAEAIRSGSSSVAVAGGVNLLLSPRNYELLERTGMLSPRGRCRTFDSGADGFVRGEGVGLVVLMSRSRAEAGGHRVRGWLRGGAVSHGGRARSLTAPNPVGQAEMLVQAYRRAGVDPASVGCVETHGTGTQLGDPVEIDALKSAFARLFADRGEAAPEDGRIALGAVKTNIGHLESAAGIAGVLKMLLAMEHGVLPPSLHLRQANPYLRLEGSPFRLVTGATPWQRRRDERGRELPLRAGVSSFGYGGVNAHVVLEEAVQPAAGGERQPAPNEQVFVLSARTPSALRAYAAALETKVKGWSAAALRERWADLAYTLRVGRDAMECRLAVVTSDPAELIAALAAHARGADAPGLVTGPPGNGGAARQARGSRAAAERWVGGGAVDFAELRDGSRPRLLSLPTYPFEEVRCWFEAPAPEREAADTERSAEPAGGLLHVPGWEEAPLPDGPRDAAGPVWLVHTEDGAALADALAERLSDRTVVRIRPDRPHDLDAAAQVAPAAVHFLAGVGRPDAEHLGSLDAQEETGVLALFGLVRGLLARPASAGTDVTVVTTDACAVDGSPVRTPGAAGLWGFARSLGRECPSWRIALLDLAFEEVARDPATAADLVLGATGLPDTRLAVRRGRCYRPVLRPAPELPAGRREERLRPGGVYLILGGAGDIGSDLAAHLVAEYGARVGLLGRSPLDEGLEERLAEVDPDGTHAVYVRADAGDPAQLRRAAETVAERFGPVNGVVHAANVLRDGALHSVSEDRFRAGLRSKTATTAAVAEVFGAEPLDFLLLFSSVQSFLGNPGQSGYAAGCAFQDACAHALDARLPYPVRVVDWGAWETSRLAESHGERLREAGVAPIPPGAGLRALTEVLGSEEVQVAVVGGTERFLAEIGVRRETAAQRPGPPAETDRDRSEEADLRAALRADVHQLVCEAAKVSREALSPGAELVRFGFDSIAYTRLSQAFNEFFGLEVTPAFFFGVSTTLDLVEKTARSHPERLRAHYARQAPPAEPAPREPAPRPAQVPSAAPPPAVPLDDEEDAVAVVGMAGKLPGSDDLAEFWAHLADGDDLVTEVPGDRWDWRGLYGDPEPGEFRTLVKWGGFMRRVDEFDPLFFGISPTEAEAMDPQHRLVLEAVWGCIEDAGIAPSALARTATGVFVGASSYDYFELQHALGTPLDGYNSVGRSHAIMANRVSYLLDLHGPSEAVDTACSSSLVAVDRAVGMIRRGECVAALAGGVNVVASPTLHVDTGHAGMLSTGDGRCKTFDARADGYVRSEGVGMVLLKRLSAAVADGDAIHGVIRGSAVNHGGRGNSLTAPSPQAQAAAVLKAYRQAGVDPRTVSYVETHGTGTSLGDPVEIDGLRAAFEELYREWGVSEPPEAHCALGAVKSNVGHLEAGAGLAGLLKTLLAMEHGVLPKNLHLEEVNPHLRLAGSPFHLLRERQEWHRPPDPAGSEAPRRGGVSSFGLGGVNAHVLVEEFRDARERQPDARAHVFVLSAANEERLRAYATRLAEWLDGPPARATPAAVARTLQAGRDPMDVRLAVVAEGLDELRDKLLAWTGGESAVPGLVSGDVRHSGADSALLLEGEEGRAYLRLVVEGGKWEKLARLWAAGAPVDWDLLWPDGAPRRLSLPTYPFARERYWLRPGEQFEEYGEDGAQGEYAPGAVSPAGAETAGAVPAEPAAPEPAPAAPSPEPAAVARNGATPDAPLEQVIAELLGRHLGIDAAALDVARDLADYGVDSLGLRRLSRALGARYGISVPARFFSPDGSIAEFSRSLREKFPDRLDRPAEAAEEREGGIGSVLHLLSSGQLGVEDAVTRLGRSGPDGR